MFLTQWLPDKKGNHGLGMQAGSVLKSVAKSRWAEAVNLLPAEKIG